jgi:16S rRNA processing protein RimM
MEYIAVAKIVQPFRLEGYLKIRVYSEIPERLKTLKSVYLSRNGEYRGFIIEDLIIRPPQVLLKLKGVDTREDALNLVQKELFVPESQKLPLEPGAFYIHDLIGMDVVTTDGEQIGKISAVYQGGANDVYEVRQGEKEVLIPAVSQFVKKVDTKTRQVIVELIEGMSDED